MDPTYNLIIDALKDEPIRDADHFIWYITVVWIIELFKRLEKYDIYNSIVEIEANKIALAITKEEKDYLEICGRKIFLFLFLV